MHPQYQNCGQMAGSVRPADSGAVGDAAAQAHEPGPGPELEQASVSSSSSLGILIGFVAGRLFFGIFESRGPWLVGSDETGAGTGTVEGGRELFLRGDAGG